MRKVLLWNFLLASLATADMGQVHVQATQDGKKAASEVSALAKSFNPSKVPGFQTDQPKEATLNASSIGEATLSAVKNSPAAQMLQEQAKDRKVYKIDPKTDPLFINGNRSVLNPEATMKEILIEEKGSQTPQDQLLTCIEGGDEYMQTCKRTLHIELNITPASEKDDRFCPGHKQGLGKRIMGKGKKYCNPGCQGQLHLIPKRVDVVREFWTDTCQFLEEQSDLGLCRYLTKQNSQKNETRTIQGESITRDHFEETYTYGCLRNASHSCEVLRSKGCLQINSVCKERQGGVCVLWEQTYKCPSSKTSTKRYKTQGDKSPFCLTGNCTDSSYNANGEILQAMSQLSVLREAQNDIRTIGCIFKGTPRHCKKNMMSFLDCCGNGKGWGKSLGLSSCSSSEKELANLRDKKRCVRVGTYCSKKVAGVCVSKKTTFCCFGTKLSKILQEQGRAQLGLNFGTPKEPDCRGLTPQELSRLDFSQMDLSELYSDIQAAMKPKMQNDLAPKLTEDRLKSNMTQLSQKACVR